MLEISKIIETFTNPGEERNFQPADVDLQNAFPTDSKESDEIPA